MCLLRGMRKPPTSAGGRSTTVSRVNDQRSACVFCGARGSRSREHLMRAKFASLLPVADSMTYHRVGPDGEVTERTIPTSQFGLVVNDVCRGCNQGWLNDLENEVEATLIAVATRQESQIIDVRTRSTIALWMTTRALLRTLQDPGGVAPQELFHAVHDERRVPDGVLVHWTQSDQPIFVGGKNTCVLLETIDDTASARERSRVPRGHHAHLVTYGLEHLFFQVSLATGEGLPFMKRHFAEIHAYLPSAFDLLAPEGYFRTPRGITREQAIACGFSLADFAGIPRPGAPRQ